MVGYSQGTMSMGNYINYIYHNPFGLGTRRNDAGWRCVGCGGQWAPERPPMAPVEG